MSMAIPFVREFVPRYGEAERLTPLIRRVLARNPGPFTFAGTGTFIVGNGASVAVIDPGPDDADHLPLARPFAQAVGAPVLGHAAVAPDTVLGDGDEVRGDGWTLRAVATPGHATEHLAFALPEENALFSGDHVMGWSTSVVSPPDGDMDAYMDSLERVIAGNYDTLWPTHGGPVTDPLPFLEALKAHRLERDRQVLDQLVHGPASALDMVPALYAGIDRALWPAAAQSLLAHLVRLDRRGDVIAAGEPSAATTYHLRG